MHGWVKCVPNFSEGQDNEMINELEGIVRSVPGVVFLRSDPDPDFNRTLFTFAGPGQMVRRAAFNLIKGAAERIDLNRHVGSHPRMGAVDVVPLVPLGNTTMESTSGLAEDLGREVGEKLGIPVFLYEESATTVERRSLAALRKGGFEGHLSSGFPGGPPDFGPPQPHPTAGSVAIGARSFIILLNLILDTNELETARTVARALRESTRGLPAVRALGLPLPSQGLVQVSINILDYKATSMTKVMEKARDEANRLGTSILQGELMGLVPREALADSVWELLNLPPQRRERVIEDAVEKSGAFTFAERLAAATPTPGSGAVAARSGLHATSLLRMVTGLAWQRLKKNPKSPVVLGIEEIQRASINLGQEFRSLELRDEEAFDCYLAAIRKARAAGNDSSEETAAAIRLATEIPLQMIQASKEFLGLLDGLLSLQKQENLTLGAGSDLGAALELVQTAFRTAQFNIRVNLPQISKPAQEELRKRCQELVSELEQRCQELRGEIAGRFLPL